MGKEIDSIKVFKSLSSNTSCSYWGIKTQNPGCFPQKYNYVDHKGPRKKKIGLKENEAVNTEETNLTREEEKKICFNGNHYYTYKSK